HQGEQAPRGDRFQFAWGAVVNKGSDLAFIGELASTPGVRSPSGIFLHSRGISAPIALPGDLMPDRRKIVTVNPARMIGNYGLNSRGDVSFNASLENGESAFYVYSQGELHLVVG